MSSAKTITLFTFFVTTFMLFPVQAETFSFSFAVAPHTAIKKSQDVSTKAQAGITADTAFSLELYEKYFIELRGRYIYFRSSGAGDDWILYRGYSSIGASFGGGFLFPDQKLFGEFPVTPSVALRGYGNFASYNHTDIYFFYPSLEIEPAVTIARFYNNHLQLHLGLPIELNFQRDLDLFISGGISFGASLHF